MPSDRHAIRPPCHLTAVRSSSRLVTAGTYEEALGHFQLAEGISPGFYIRNRLMIAKCSQQLRDKPAARKWAAAALEISIVNNDDRTAAADATQLLAAL